MTHYTVFKRTASHADALAAIGAADVLRRLDARIAEFEDRFEIQLRKELAPADLDAVDPGFSYLELPRKKRPELPPERAIRSHAGSAANASSPGSFCETPAFWPSPPPSAAPLSVPGSGFLASIRERVSKERE